MMAVKKSICAINLLIFLQLISPTVAFSTQKWCTKMVPVRRTRIAWRQSSQMITKRTWYGKVYSVWSPFTYTETEHYNDFERQRQCCSGYTETYLDCEPICSPDCPANSYCDMPQTCKCNAGYEGNPDIPTYISCSPICTKGCPLNSKCVRPDTCVCTAGYRPRNGSCEPVCESGCPENANCTAPNSCQCNEGYTRRADGTCEPICFSGCSSNSWCDAPNHCRCNNGYLMSADQICAPNCEIGCPAHGFCLAPDQCQCQPGYRLIENGTICEPQCSNGCPEKSNCISPEHCECTEGYQLRTQHVSQPYCEPICTMNCSAYGKCVSPEVCDCFPGYEMYNETIANGSLCRPRCSRGCEHGFCFAPEICVCDPGYLMGPDSACEATCSMGCVHGKCVEPEICACNEGHRFREQSVNICEPICEPQCEHADCVMPNFCICWQGYHPAENSATACVPTCPTECLHGHCNASFECSCDEGYVPHPYLSNECVPRCENCQNGDCPLPDECNCWPGYRLRVGETEQCVWISSTSTVVSSTMEHDITGTSSGTAYDDATTETSEGTYFYTEPSTTITTAAIFDTASPQADFLSELVTVKFCDLQCKCWTEIDEFGSINTAKCLKICVDYQDEPCLNISLCRCDLLRLQLVCNNTDDSMEDAPRMLYKCPMPIYIPKGTTEGTSYQMSEAEQRSREPSIDHGLLWWIVGTVACVSLILGLAALGLILLRKSREENCDYDIVYHEGRASLTS